MPFHLPPALTHRKYLYLWLGLLISVAGSNMQFAAIHWHIRELTGEPDLPVIVFSIIGGAVADNYNRRRILFITQSVAALQAATLAFFTFTGQITVWHIYLLTAIQAATMAFDSTQSRSLP
jgi:MFS family permease